MTTPTADLTVRPRGAWYLLVAVLWVASAIVVGTVVATFVRVIDHGVTPVQASHVVSVPDSGLTIYSRTRPVTHDCFLGGPSGRTIRMDGLSYDLNVTFGGTTVYAVATTPDGLAPGSYVLSCPGVDLASQLYYGDRFPLASILIRLAIAAVLGLSGVVMLIVLLVRRHTSKSRIRTQRLMTAPGYGAGWPGQGWPAGPPASPYGQPPPYEGQPPPPYGQPPPPPYGQPPPPPYGQQPPPYDDGTQQP